MSAEIKLGLVQMSMSGDKKVNLEKALKLVNVATKKGAQIVCLPELFTSIYFPQGENYAAKKIAEKIPGLTTGELSKAAKKNKIFIVGGSICEKSDGKLYNTSVVFDTNGKIISKYRKIHIPHDPDFYEQNYFTKGDLGYKTFEVKGAKIGTMICYDQWYPEAARVNALMGAEIIFYPTAIGTVKGVEQREGNWQEAWENVQRGHAISNGVMVSAVNRVGVEGNMTFWGGSFVIDQFGKTLARAGGKEEVLVVSCNLQLGKEVKEGWRFLYNRRPDTYRKILEK